MGHTFADDGTYPLSVSDFSGAYTATLDAAVSNVAPVVTLTGATSVDEGAPYDPGPARASTPAPTRSTP